MLLDNVGLGVKYYKLLTESGITTDNDLLSLEKLSEERLVEFGIEQKDVSPLLAEVKKLSYAVVYHSFFSISVLIQVKLEN